MESSLSLESMPTLCRSTILPAETTIREGESRQLIAEANQVASSVTHRKDYMLSGVRVIAIQPAPQQLSSLVY